MVLASTGTAVSVGAPLPLDVICGATIGVATGAAVRMAVARIGVGGGCR